MFDFIPECQIALAPVHEDTYVRVNVNSPVFVYTFKMSRAAPKKVLAARSSELLGGAESTSHETSNHSHHLGRG